MVVVSMERPQFISGALKKEQSRFWSSLKRWALVPKESPAHKT